MGANLLYIILAAVAVWLLYAELSGSVKYNYISKLSGKLVTG